jgi:gluconolactonase
MHFKSCLMILVTLFLLSCKDKVALENTESTKFIGSIQVNDLRLLEVIDTTQKIEILADGFTWSEGPLWLDNLQKLVFTDVPENTIYSWDSKNSKQLYLKPSGYTIADTTGGREGANGLALDAKGYLVMAQHGNRAIALMDVPLDKPEPKFKFLAQKFNNKRFSSPNDLHIALDGSIFLRTHLMDCLDLILLKLRR